MSDIDRAVSVLRAGGLVAIPTETVYGLAADASNASAVRRVFAVKGRPADHPLIVHVGAPAQLGHWAATIPPAAAVLADACWPGPLTLLVPRAATVLDVVTYIQRNLDPTLLLGPLSRLFAGADDVLARAGGRDGHIFNLGHGILPQTPVEHVRALARYVHQQSAR